MEPIREIKLAEDQDLRVTLSGRTLIFLPKESELAVRIPLSAEQAALLLESKTSPRARIEAERRFLCTAAGDEVIERLHAHVRPTELEQHYLLLNHETKTCVRARWSEIEGTLTLKIGEGERRGEFEISIDRLAYDALRDLAEHELRFSAVRKDRYLLPDGWEIDCMSSPCPGEIMAEFEYQGARPDPLALAQELSAELGGQWRDITEDSRYTNASIAERGFPYEGCAG